MKTIAIIQARLTSKRFPSKVLKKIGKHTLIQLINERLKLSKFLDDIVFSIPNNEFSLSSNIARWEKISIIVLK